MFRIKICGVTNPEDAELAIDAGADAIGLNFYAGSKRFIEPERATTIADAIAGRATVVGVFVNASAVQVRQTAAGVGLTAVQLHGDEPPTALAEIPAACPIVRARRIDGADLASVAEDIAACREAGRAPDAVLVDARSADQYGGTGETIDWAGLANSRELLGDTPLILAGGLTPGNVAEAIRVVRPEGVDTASGVESSPGRKDHELVRRFVAAAREALAG